MYKYVLVIVDLFSRWAEAFPTHRSDVTTVAKVQLKVVLRFGIPKVMSNDNGPHFTGLVVKEQLKGTIEESATTFILPITPTIIRGS